jgi:predicted esterase
LTLNSIEGWNTSVTINLYHGTEDDNVPPRQSLNLYNQFISAGSDTEKVKHFPMEGYSHGQGLFPWGIRTINWFNMLRN